MQPGLFFLPKDFGHGNANGFRKFPMRTNLERRFYSAGASRRVMEKVAVGGTRH
jgi:hypothetical protein